MARVATNIYFCDPAPRFDALKATDIPAPTRRAIRRLCERDNRHGLVAALFAALWAIGVCLSCLRLCSPPLPQLVGYACSVVALVGLSICLHEASHGLLFRNSVLNELIGFFCGVPLLIPVSAFRTNHRLHHRRRGDHGGPVEEVFDFALLRSLPVYCLGLLVKSFGFATALPIIAIAKADSRTRCRTLGEYALIASGVWLAVRTLPWHALWQGWLLPLMLTAFLSQLRAVAEHGLTAKGSVFTASRTVRCGRLMSLIMCNINYHLEHHLFPGVPWYSLPTAHALLGEEYRQTGASVYGTYRRVFVDFLRATWRGIRPHTRLIATEHGRPAVGWARP